MPEHTAIWGLPLARLTLAQTIDALTDLVEARRPSYVITANTHYAMLTQQVQRLREVNARASFIVADGAPLVYASRWKGSPLPERVAGSDLIYGMCERAAGRGFGVFFCGGADGVADEAGRRLSRLYPGLRVAGTASPPFRALSRSEERALSHQIRVARPEILFVAFGQPKGELWIADHCESLGVPVSVQIGASLDFVAGRVRRAPVGLQRVGMEWAYRMWHEPARLAPRYFRNAVFLAQMMAHDLTEALPGGTSRAGGTESHLAEVEAS
jgi:N-acetylglucosaminyldiphosphoundecaprenol N-acetyl-beta-D-mannosaminyltransferase